MTEVNAFLSSVTARVDSVLDRLLPSADTEPNRLHEAVRWSVFGGGKRFRPALVLAVGSVYGAKEEELAMTAAAIEMIHTYSLIHDDLPAMDNDDLRRGRSTCHKKFDEATAILAGDALHALAFGAIANDRAIDFETRVALSSVIAAAAGTPDGMVAGQQMDLDAEGQAVSREHVERIHKHKTGALISASAVSGGLIAGASSEQLDLIRGFGDRLGLLFQITDDLLDRAQPSEILGKTAGKDVSAEKATYPSVIGVEASEALCDRVHDEIVRGLDNFSVDTSLLAALVDYVRSRRS